MKIKHTWWISGQIGLETPILYLWNKCFKKKKKKEQERQCGEGQASPPYSIYVLQLWSGWMISPLDGREG